MLPRGKVPREPDNPSAKVWASLVALILLLAFIVLARDRLAAGAAGCYQQSSTASAVDHADDSAGDKTAPPRVTPVTPEFSVAREPAR